MIQLGNKKGNAAKGKHCQNKYGVRFDASGAHNTGKGMRSNNLCNKNNNKGVHKKEAETM